MKKITVIGTGYVGLVSGTCFAELGNDVTCVDIDEQKVRSMQHGKIPIYEPGLEDIFTRNTHAGRLHFTTVLEHAIPKADVILLALPTPPHEDGSADLSYVLDVAAKLSPLLRGYTVIVTKSTVPVGTGEQIASQLKLYSTATADVVSNPEFLREGVAVHDFMQPDRIVVGSESAQATKIMQELYEPLTANGSPLIIMDRRSSELTKYAANSFLALKISFMNEIANLCERVGADVNLIQQGIGSDKRIGKRFLHAGIGYGGSCFPKDVQALLHTARQHHYGFNLLQTVIELNTSQQRVLTQKVLNYFKGSVAGKTFALWGLAFKPDTDDIRQAPALGIIHDLLDAGATIQAYDPQAIPNVRARLGGLDRLVFTEDEYAALNNADALLIATEWPQFKGVSLEKTKQHIKQPVIFDGRNIFAPADMQKHGFYYESIGRKIVKP